MPTYHFRCPDGHDFDRFYKTISGAPAEVPCPHCGQQATRQLSGGAGLLFKGSGFYLTDYGKNAHRKPAPEKPEQQGAGAQAGGDAPKGESTASRAESKPEPKADAPKPKADTATPKPKAE